MYFETQIYNLGFNIGHLSHKSCDTNLKGFNGKEKDDEIKGSGNSYDFGARMYDSRLGRFFSTDPREADYSSNSPYLFANNNGIVYIDFNGEFGRIYSVKVVRKIKVYKARKVKGAKTKGEYNRFILSTKAKVILSFNNKGYPDNNQVSIGDKAIYQRKMADRKDGGPTPEIQANTTVEVETWSDQGNTKSILYAKRVDNVRIRTINKVKFLGVFTVKDTRGVVDGVKSKIPKQGKKGRNASKAMGIKKSQLSSYKGVGDTRAQKKSRKKLHKQLKSSPVEVIN
jgi:RHS repeat-associated protein